MPAIPQSRRQGQQIVNIIKKTVNYSDAGISTGIAMAESLPVGAFITGAYVEVVTAFNASSTNVLTVGTNSTSYNDIVNAADVTEGTTGVYVATRGWGRALAATAEKPIYVKYTQTGTAASAGQAVIVITYEGGWST
jgi:hypothetical protein